MNMWSNGILYWIFFRLWIFSWITLLVDLYCSTMNFLRTRLIFLMILNKCSPRCSVLTILSGSNLIPSSISLRNGDPFTVCNVYCFSITPTTSPILIGGGYNNRIHIKENDNCDSLSIHYNCHCRQILSYHPIF